MPQSTYLKGKSPRRLRRPIPTVNTAKKRATQWKTVLIFTLKRLYIGGIIRRLRVSLKNPLKSLLNPLNRAVIIGESKGKKRSRI
jgi:hypothetical protein